MRSSLVGVLVALACMASAKGQESRPESAPASRPAMEAGQYFATGRTYEFRSTVLDEDREIIVSYPDTFGVEKKVFPVLYLLDGPHYFNYTVGLVEMMQKVHLIPDMFVVGISNTDRSRDLTPGVFSDVPGSGGGAKFLEFLETEVKPRVRALLGDGLADFEILCGHSLGGLIGQHALLTRQADWDGYILCSPTHWLGHGELSKALAKAMNVKRSRSVFVYYGWGELEKQTFRHDAVAAAHARENPENFEVASLEIASADHFTGVHRIMEWALGRMFEGWGKLGGDTPADIRTHHRTLSERLRLPSIPREGAVNRRGYAFMSDDKFAEAVALFRMNLEFHPDSADAHDSLGEGLAAQGNLDEAIVSFKKAIELGVAQEHPSLADFRAHLESAEAKRRKKE